MPERREDLIERLFEAGRITDEERALLADRPRLQASTALAYAAGAILVVLGAGLIGALLGVGTAAWVRVAVVGGLAVALGVASWLLRLRRVLAAALALYIGATAVSGAVVRLLGAALWPAATWAAAAESWAFLALAVGFWRGWRGPALSGVLSVAAYLATVSTAHLLLGNSFVAGRMALDVQLAAAGLMVALGIWISRRPAPSDHAFWPCLVGLLTLDLSLIGTAWLGTADGWWLVAVQALLVALFWQVGRVALGGLAVVGGLAFLSRQISGQLFPHSPLGASVLSIVAAAAALIWGTAYLRRHPRSSTLDRGSVWWAEAER